jgi:hypothetical protein
MPYAPGEHYLAGDYFAAMGPRISQNIQNWQQNRQERDQAVASAEMIGRYLKDDPQAMEMFGEKLAKVPSMSTGAARGVIGSAAMYMTQQRLKAEAQDQAARTDLLKKEQALRADEAAQRLEAQNRLGTFNRYVSQQLNPPMSYAPGSEPSVYRPTLDPDAVMRYAAESGVLGQPETTGLLNAVSTYSQRTPTKPEEFTISGRKGVYSPRTGTFQMLEDSGAGGTPIAQTIRDDEGNVVGKGFVSGKGGVQMLPKEKPEAPPKLSSADETFLNIAPVYAQQLDDYAKAVDKYGGAEIFDQAGSAALGQLAYQTAISNAKISDPSSVAREGEVESAKKYMIPAGWGTRTKVTKAAIEGARNDLVNRVRTWSENNNGKLPENMPLWLRVRVSTKTGEFTSPEQVRKALDMGHLTWDEAAAIITQKFSGDRPKPGGGASGGF